jgi:(2Fe-2S) ferredoxin
MKFRKHLFICTNQRAAGEKKSCGEAHGLELVKSFKRRIKDLGLNVEIRAQRAGCIDACDFGPSMVVYPEGVFYGGVSLDDVEEIIEQHLIRDKPVERLIIQFPPTG